jgi:hypothetical protein
MVDLRRHLPLLSRHEGIWDGWYRHFGPDCAPVDTHRSRLVCRFPAEGPVAYHQTNHYSWSDGRTEVRDFPASYLHGRIVFDNELIEGWAAEDPLDDFHRTVLLHWVRKGEPDLYLYEMIQLSDCGGFRHRVWQWFRAGRLVQRTLIDETRVAGDWRALRGPSFAGDPV